MKNTNNIYSVLFNKIILGKYSAGFKLKEEELSTEFGISRTPVREVLRQLSQDGLVELLPKRSATVIGFTADDVEEIYEIRCSLELQALRYSAPFLNINGLRDLRREVQEVAETDNIVRVMETDERLHNYFVHVSGKRRLIAILDQMYRLLHHFREYGFKVDNVREATTRAHLDIIDALSIRDIERAEQHLKDHILQGKKNAISHILTIM